MRILNIGAKLDRSGAKELLKALQSESIEGGSVFFNVSRLEELNGNSLAEMFALVGEVLERGGRPAIWGASDKLRAMFELVQLNKVAEICALDCRATTVPAQTSTDAAFAGLVVAAAS
jgi:anti-anti-sigma regulatory factor